MHRYCEPQSWRRPRPRAIPLAKPPMWARTPWRDKLQRRPAVALPRDVPADDVRSTVVDGREEPAPALRPRPRTAIASVPEKLVGRPRSGSGQPCVRCPRGRPRRTGASSPCSRISLSTRFLPTRNPPGRQPRPHLPVALAEERTRLPAPSGPPPPAPRRSVPSSGPASTGSRRSDSGGSANRAQQRVHARTRDPPRLAHHRQRLGPPRRRTHPSKRLKSCPQLVPVPPFFEKHQSATRPASSSPPASPWSASARLAAEFLPFKPSWPPCWNSRRHRSSSGGATRISRLTSTMSSPWMQPRHHLRLPLLAPPFGEAGRPPQTARAVLFVRAPRHPAPPVSWTPDGLPIDCPEKSGALSTRLHVEPARVDAVGTNLLSVQIPDVLWLS